MKITITEKARRLYGENCPFSSARCESLEELDYKIQRCIDLGENQRYDEQLTFVQYYNLEFIVLKNKIIDIQKIKSQNYEVDEKDKITHYNHHYRVVV